LIGGLKRLRRWEASIDFTDGNVCSTLYCQGMKLSKVKLIKIPKANTNSSAALKRTLKQQNNGHLSGAMKLYAGQGVTV
jgi:hypothetical protein